MIHLHPPHNTQHYQTQTKSLSLALCINLLKQIHHSLDLSGHNTGHITGTLGGGGSGGHFGNGGVGTGGHFETTTEDIDITIGGTIQGGGIGEDYPDPQQGGWNTFDCDDDPDGEFQCFDGQIIPCDLRCDNKPDCNDDSDEEKLMCDEVFRKEEEQKQTEEAEVFDCFANPEGRFVCRNGEVIPCYLRCDGVPNCVDHSDESVDECPGTEQKANYYYSYYYTIKPNAKQNHLLFPLKNSRYVLNARAF